MRKEKKRLSPMQSERNVRLIPGLTGWHVMWSPAEVNRFLSGVKRDVPRQMLAANGWTGSLGLSSRPLA